MMTIRRSLLVALLLAGLLSMSKAQESPPTPTPTPAEMPRVNEDGRDIVNILLMGSATSNGATNPGLTDTLMIVSMDRDSGHVAVVSIPRDLYVYVPALDAMHKINQAYFLTERATENSGVPALRATVRYNLGLEIDYYARVDFEGFGTLVDSLGGIHVAVDCAIEDWRLIDPDLDEDDPDSWEMFTLWTGLHWMSGDTALWYVRSRRTSNDIDRTRRQQDVLRAIWRRIRQQGMLENFPALWTQFNQMVDTDMTLPDALALLPVVTELDAADVAYYTFRIHQEVEQGYTDDEGRFIFLPNRDAIADLMQTVVAPPNNNRLSGHLPTVAIYNGSGVDGLAYVAAHRLERDGFRTTVIDAYTHPRRYNLIIDYTGERKNSPLPLLQRILSTTNDGVQIDPTPDRAYDYEVRLGYTYQFYACTYPVEQPTLSEDASASTD